MSYFELYQESPSLFVIVLLISFVVTIFVYGAFPFVFAKTRKTPITKKKYKRLCYGLNIIGMVFFVALNGAVSGGPYLLWTWIFSNYGVKILTSRGLLKDNEQPNDGIELVEDVLAICNKGSMIEKNRTQASTYENNTKANTNTDEVQNEKSVRTYADGSKYVGNIVEGKRHGRGIYTHPNGNVYTGDWERDAPHGQGLFVSANGDAYNGEWANGKRHGKGVYTYADGRVIDGEWENGAPCKISVSSELDKDKREPFDDESE